MTTAFGCVYLDTNILRQSRWPNLSADLQALLQLARRVGIAVLIPEAAEMECQRRWVKEIKEHLDALKTSHLPIPKHLTDLSPEDLKTHYNELSKSAKAKWHITEIPTTRRAVRELVEMAIERQPPFKDSGVGFQDMVIYLSAVDHLVTVGSRGAFVSKDRDFQTEAVRKLNIAVGVEMDIVQELSTVVQKLKEALAEEERNQWELDTSLAKAALRRESSFLEAYFFEFFEPRVHSVARPGESLEVLTLYEITKVQTPSPGERTAGDKVRIVFDASICLQLTTAGASGIQLPYDDEESTSAIDLGSEGVFRPVGVQVKAEVEARWTGADYDEIEFVGMRSAALLSIH